MILRHLALCFGVEIDGINVKLLKVLVWGAASPTKYWNILEILIPGADISSRHELFVQKVGRLGSIWSFYCVILDFEAIWSHFL